MKKSWKNLDGNFWDRQRQESDVKCACGCGGFISVRAAKAKAKGSGGGYLKGHFYKGRGLPESAKQKMRENHADFSGDKNPNYGKGLFGPDNPNWQGGKKKKYYSGGNQPNVSTKKDRAFKVRIKERDGKCVLCENKTRLECHHIQSWVNHPELRFDPKNCVTLCKPCHTRADNQHHKDRIRPMLKAYVENINQNPLPVRPQAG